MDPICLLHQQSARQGVAVLALPRTCRSPSPRSLHEDRRTNRMAGQPSPLWGAAIDQVVPRSSPLRRAAFLEYSGNDLRDHRLVRYSLRGALSAGIV